MGIYINRTAWLQYIAIYIMLLFNSSNFYAYNIDGKLSLQLIIIVVLAGILFFRYNRQSRNAIFASCFFLFFVLIVRIISGGIGIGFWNEIAIKILCTSLAILIDKENFGDRYIKVVSILGAISLFFWGLQLLGINLAKLLFRGFVTRNNVISWDTGSKVVTNLTGYGQLIYSYLGISENRNISIFSEPGIYQMVLNSALFVLIFLEDNTSFSVKQKRKLFILLSCCLVSTQSTSGYLGYVAILLCLFLKRNQFENESVYEAINWKKIGTMICLFGVVALGADYAVRGDASLINVAFISKVFNSSNQFTLIAENSTGIYRAASIMMALIAMVRYPYGLGVDKWTNFYLTNQYAGPGGWPFKLGAVIGVVPFIYLMYWIFSPMREIKRDPVAIGLFVFLYFNTSLAQSSAVYPVLIMIPMYLRSVEYNQYSDEE